MYLANEVREVKEQCTELSPANLKYVLAVAAALKFAEDTTVHRVEQPRKPPENRTA